MENAASLSGSCASDAVTIPMTETSRALRESIRERDLCGPLRKERFAQTLAKVYTRSGQVFPQVETTCRQRVISSGGNDVHVLGEDEASCIVMYVHGGAYAFDADPEHVLFCDKLARQMDAQVFMPLYPLAPQASWRDAFPFLDGLYMQLLAQGKPVFLMGDSAGGGLALAFAQRLRDCGRTLPERLVLISPWLDVSMDNPAIAQFDELDVSLKVYGLLRLARLWADGLDVHDPRVSPIYGDMAGLPPTLLFSGTAEVMLPDISALHGMMLASGDESKFVLGEDLWHEFVVWDIPESDTAFKMILDFCQ